MGIYEGQRTIIAILVFVWVVMCGTAISATGKADANVQDARQWLLNETMNVGRKVQPLFGLESDLPAYENPSALCTQNSISKALSAQSAKTGRRYLPELTYYM